MAYIYTKSGNIRCEVKSFVYDGSFMGIPTITANIESHKPIDFSVGDYFIYDYDGITYKIQNSQEVKKNARINSVGNAFVYQNVLFESPLAELKYIDFLDYVVNDNEVHFSTLSEFSFIGTVYDFAQRILANIQRIHSTGWNVIVMNNGAEVVSNNNNNGSDIIYQAKNISVSNIKIFEALGTINEQWKVSFVFKIINNTNTIVINDVLALTEPAQYGKGNGLYSLTKSVNTDHQVTTRIRAFGNSKNLPAKYFTKQSGLEDFHAISNLMIPRSKWKDINNPISAFIDADDENVGGAEDTSLDNFGIRENTIRFDGTDNMEDIFPSIKGVTAGKLREEGVNPDYVPKAVHLDNDRMDLIDSVEIPDDNGLDMEEGHVLWDNSDNIVINPATPDNMPLSPSSYLPNYMTASGKSIFGGYTICSYTPNKTRRYKFEFSGVNHIIANVSATDSNNENARVCITKAKLQICTLEQNGPRTFVDMKYNIGLRVENNDVCSIYLEDSGNNNITIELTAGESYYFIIVYEGTSSSIIQTDNSAFLVGTLNLFYGKLIYTDYFYLTIKQIGFKLDDYITNSDTNIQITMNTGGCAARSFYYCTNSCVYNSDDDTWTLKLKRSRDDSMGQVFPNNQNVIESGDEFVISGHIFPDFYVRIAENKLYNAACAWLLSNKEEQFIYEIEIDNKIAFQLSRRIPSILIKEGMNLPLYDPDLGIGDTENYEAIPIDNVSIENGNSPLPVFKVVLRKEKDGSQLTSIVNKATKGYATINDVNNIANVIGGTIIHDSLEGRSNKNQHTIDSITGLRELINSIPSLENLLQRFLSRRDDDSAAGQITFLQGLISNVIESRGAVMNDYAGQGFIMKMVDGKAKLELDEIVVRQAMKVFEIIIQQWSWQGGIRIDSAAAIEAISVTELENGYKVFFDKDKHKQKFVVNDQARCQRFDTDIVTTKYYWRLVTEVGADYIVLSKTDKDGTGIPDVNDSIIQLGNRSIVNRQAAIIYTSVGENSPKIEFYGGIDNYNLETHRVTLMGIKNGAMTLVTSNGEFSGKVIIGAGSTGIENIDGWNEMQTKIESYANKTDINKKVIDSLSDDSEFDITEKNSIRTMWENINGLNSLSGFGTNGSYRLCKQFFADFPFDEEKVILSYNDNVVTYNEKLVVYNLWGVGDLDTAYYNLRNYLSQMRLYSNRVKSGFNRVRMASYFTDYYDAESALIHKINDYKAKKLQEGIVAATKYSLVLSNDNASIACDANGNVVGTLPQTRASIYYGATLSSGWNISIVTTGCVASIVGTSGNITTISVTSIQLDNAEVLVVAEKEGLTAINAAFTLTKVRAGIGFNGFEEYYCWGNSGTVQPTTQLSQWTQDSIPNRPADATYRYLWNYEKILRNEGNPQVTTPKCISVDGKELSSTTEYYAITASYQEPSVSSTLWGSAGVKVEPTTAKPYLWNKTVTTYTDGTTSTIVHLLAQRGENGTNGTNGTNGADGADGADAIIYWVEPSVTIIKKSWTGTLLPTSISCAVMKQIGNNAAVNITSAAISSSASPKLYYQLSNGNLTAYSSGISVGNATYIDFILKQGSTIIDKERVPVLVDASELDISAIEEAIDELEEHQNVFIDALADINNDSVLTPSEKKAIRGQWEVINGGFWGTTGLYIGASGTFQAALDLIAKSGFDASPRPSSAGQKRTAYDNLLAAKNALGNKTTKTGAFFALRTYLQNNLDIYVNDSVAEFDRMKMASLFTDYYYAHEVVIKCVNEWYRVVSEEMLSQFDYLKEVLLTTSSSDQVLIANGIALASALFVRNGSANTSPVVAGMIGKTTNPQDGGAELPMLFAGSSSASEIRTALMRLYKDGRQIWGNPSGARIEIDPDTANSGANPEILLYNALGAQMTKLSKEGLFASAGTFAGYLQMPFKSINEAGSTLNSTTGVYAINENLNVICDANQRYSQNTYQIFINIPVGANRQGQIINLWMPPVITSMGPWYNLHIADHQNRFVDSSVIDSSGYPNPFKQFTTGGGFLQLIAIPYGTSIQWIISIKHIMEMTSIIY